MQNLFTFHATLHPIALKTKCIGLTLIFIFRSTDWLFITNSLKGYLYFPKLLFNKIKSMEKQKSYGARSSEYYYMTKNYQHDFEYKERIKIISYCPFEFSTFPFDVQNCDLTIGSGSSSITYTRILKPTVIYEKFKSKEKSIPIESQNVPFEIKAESITPFLIEKNGLNYSYSGIRIVFKRNSLGLLIGRFYGPTATFSAFSILSYNINIDMVKNNYSLPHL